MNEVNRGLPEIFRTREFVGWEVVDESGAKSGTVADLLIDATGRVRFVDVEYGFPKKHVLIPQDRLQWGERRLIIDSWTRNGLATLPPYDPSRPLDGAMVSELQRAYPAVYDSDAHDWRAPAGDARVVPLSEAKDFKLEKGAPDIRGWNVFGSDGERAGVVSQLLVDPTALKVRYAEVDVHQDLYLWRDDRRVLVPLELIELRERGKDAWVSGLTTRELASLPAYTGGPLSAAMEMAVQRAFSRSDSGTARLEPGDPGDPDRL